jgi:hypothetical protein
MRTNKGEALGEVGRRRFFAVALAGLAATACAKSQDGVSAQPVPPLTSAPVPPTSTQPSIVPVADSGAVPAHLLIGFCGAPGAKALGEMTGDLDAASRKLDKQIAQYHDPRAKVPVVELIATTANRSPGPDGMYRSRASDATIQRYLEHARATKALLLLNIQPGRADFLPEVQAYERWLKEPDVGLALDPEWAVDAGVVPGQKFGWTTGAELDSVAAYLSGLAAGEQIPDKLLIYHQVASSVVRKESGLRPHPGVTPVKVVDGIGSPAAKKATWNLLMKDKPEHVQAGFKLFFQEDTRRGAALMTPAEVMALTPTPSYVLYE